MTATFKFIDHIHLDLCSQVVIFTSIEYEIYNVKTIRLRQQNASTYIRLCNDQYSINRRINYREYFLQNISALSI